MALDEAKWEVCGIDVRCFLRLVSPEEVVLLTVARTFGSGTSAVEALAELRPLFQSRDNFLLRHTENGEHFFVIRDRSGDLLARGRKQSGVDAVKAEISNVIRFAGASISFQGAAQCPPVDPYVYLVSPRLLQRDLDVIEARLKQSNILLATVEDIEPCTDFDTRVSELVLGASFVVNLFVLHDRESSAALPVEIELLRSSVSAIKVCVESKKPLGLDSDGSVYNFPSSWQFSLQHDRHNASGAFEHVDDGKRIDGLVEYIKASLSSGGLDDASIEDTSSISKLTHDEVQTFSPIQIVVDNGKLALRDAPIEGAPAVLAPIELKARISALRHSIDTMVHICYSDNSFQLPRELFSCLSALSRASALEPPIWFCLDDAKRMLATCMQDCFAEDSWNATVVTGLRQITLRVDELECLLRPVRLEGARPPPEDIPFPTVEVTQVEEVVRITSRIAHEMERTSLVLDQSVLQSMERIALSAESIAHHVLEPKVKRRRVSDIVLSAVFVVGGILTAIGTGVVVNLLTAQGAVELLAAKLKPLYDTLLQFFRRP
ncbi:hypothetical protein [Pseudooceanicola sp. LIPI14-2-Ac024]|uniref:hypothetical protein n=1 Tax=Pseudooceanicola sp. LIPI14-2-Ac024 TaxID=3344875 RepID=UPI0035CFDE85